MKRFGVIQVWQQLSERLDDSTIFQQCSIVLNIHSGSVFQDIDGFTTQLEQLKLVAGVGILDDVLYDLIERSTVRQEGLDVLPEATPGEQIVKNLEIGGEESESLKDFEVTKSGPNSSVGVAELGTESGMSSKMIHDG